MDKQKLLGRPLKIYYCPPRPGDVWPPEAGDRLLAKPGTDIFVTFTLIIYF